MFDLLNYVVDRICDEDVQYAPILRAQLSKMDTPFSERAESYFEKYNKFIVGRGKTIDFGIDCFRQLRANVQEERLSFLRTGRYSSQSFEDVNRRVYSNSTIMESYMHGLVFAQFFWPEQYRRFSFFCENLTNYQGTVRSYLEIGAGHGLYINEAARVFNECPAFDLVDISATSIELSRGISCEPRIRYILRDILEFDEAQQYDFITLGEVLEHLERPQELLWKTRSLLSPKGHAYITTPANAPMVDHIYLFRNADEIRAMLKDAGFAIVREVMQYAAELPEKRCIALKTALMFGAIVRKV